MSFDLTNRYDQASFLDFMKDFLPDFQRDVRDVSEESRSFENAMYLGISQKLDLQVFEITVAGSLSKRITIASDAFRLMRGSASYRALIIFHSADTNEWRLSLMTCSPKLEDGKVTFRFSNPRRYSYLLGPDAKVATPTKFLINSGKIKDYEDLQKRFSVEVVNNEFYRAISHLYDELVGAGGALPKLIYPSQGEESNQFAVRLIGRIVFCWFLREKRSNTGVPLIKKELLSLTAVDNKNYYHNVLAPLFFEVLNKPIERRPETFQSGNMGEVPYLNGGLFSPQPEDFYKFDPISNSSSKELVEIPDSWLRSFLELLETYHFTVDENTSVDVELSIDPEMLGRIFENLLARINPETGETVRKSTGSFYTPREIVEYMVNESLCHYLLSHTGIQEEKLRSLFSYDFNDGSQDFLDDEERQKAVRALSKVKILDPACGSGAFPIGILQKIVHILQRIDPDSKLWFENQMRNTSPEVRNLIEREFANKNFDYIRKLGVIRESIFGVDIQTIATEIARLRCFLTLIVDERINDKEENRGVYPLPNLDFKFVTANTLLKLDMQKMQKTAQQGLFEDQSGIDELKRLRDDYFDSHNNERDSLKLQFLQAQNQMLQNMIRNHSHGYSGVTEKLSTWDPFSNKSTGWFDSEWMFGVSDGFDIVLGNPPYVDSETMVNDDKEFRSHLSKLYKTAKGNWDLYIPFIELGFSQLGDKGLLTYITPNKWFSVDYGKALRTYIVGSITRLVNLGSVNVFDAGNNPTVFSLCKSKTNLDVTIDVMSSEYEIIETRKISRSTLDPDNFEIILSKNTALLEKFHSANSKISDYFLVQNPFTVSEAYLVKDLIHEAIIVEDSFKFCNTGTIAQFGNKWGTRTTNYLKSKYQNPVVSQSAFKVQFPKRYQQSVQPKIIFKGMRQFDSFYDELGEFIAGKTTLIAIPLNENVDAYGFLGILNSKVIKWYMKELYSSRGIDGGIAFSTKMIETIPLPENKKLLSEISKLSRLLSSSDSSSTGVIRSNLEELVIRLYGLTAEEAATVLES